MKKVFKMDNLGCASCASKMEDKISKVDGVKSVNINFMMQKMTLEAEDNKFESAVKQAAKICKKVEPECEISF